MILVLLYSFSESPDSIVGYKLCETLVKEGHDLLVTSTTPEGRLRDLEIKKAEELTKEFGGSIGVLFAEHSQEQPSIESIAIHHEHAFGDFSKLKDRGIYIDTVIGTIPGTTQTAVELKQAFKCKAILLAVTEISPEQMEIKNEISEVAKKADEIWSLRFDTYNHYQTSFLEKEGFPVTRHREIFVQPVKSSMKYEGFKGNRKAFISQWNNGFPFFHRTQRTSSNGSNEDNFVAFGAALGEIQNEMNREKQGQLRWKVCGLKSQPAIIESLEKYTAPPNVALDDADPIMALHNFNWSRCFAFIAPDIVDESFNFTALTAILMGVPTIVSSQSSVGRLLMQLKDCPFQTRAVPELTGNVEVDSKIWLEKLNKEILGPDANPTGWAKELGEYLCKKLPDEGSFPRICPRHTESLLSSYCENCKFAICNKCKLDSHSDHEVDGLSDVLESLRKRCQETLSTSQERQKKYMNN